jgi:hypothetical protein
VTDPHTPKIPARLVRLARDGVGLLLVMAIAFFWIAVWAWFLRELGQW